MDPISGNGSQRASEDSSEAREHVRQAEENRDALAAQSQRTEATAPSSVDEPVRGTDTGGMGASASDDASRAQSNVHEAERNRDALEAQSERVDRTTPDELRDR